MCITPRLSFNDWTYVAYSDLCGFKKMMENREGAYEALNCLFSSTCELLRTRLSVKGLAVSDCVIAWANDKELLSIVDFARALHKKMIRKRYLMRTTIAYGQFEFQDRIKLANLDKQMIWGGAYLAAYLGNGNAKPGSIALLDEQNVPDAATLPRDWRWERRTGKKGRLQEYYWAANNPGNIREIKEVQRLQKKHEQCEKLKELYSLLVSSSPDDTLNNAPAAAGR